MLSPLGFFSDVFPPLMRRHHITVYRHFCENARRKHVIIRQGTDDSRYPSMGHNSARVQGAVWNGCLENIRDAKSEYYGC